MNRLLGIGFQVAGEWHLENAALRIAFERYAEENNILYAFVCDGEVKYVGVSTQTLRKRMAGYRSPGPKSTTNIRNNRNIREMLAQGGAVQVLVLPDSGLMHYGPFHLNLAAGLEASIIRTLRPEWNIVANRLMKELGGEGEPDLVELPADPPPSDVPSGSRPEEEGGALEPQGTFEFTLQRSYRDKGFFNAGVAANELLGAGGERLEIFFGDQAQRIWGTINRTATANKTPRIYGGKELQQRFQGLSEQTRILVEVLSPTSIRLRVVAVSAQEPAR